MITKSFQALLGPLRDVLGWRDSRRDANFIVNFATSGKKKQNRKQIKNNEMIVENAGFNHQ